MKVKKIKMMLISFIVVRPSSSNKVKILLLDRSFIPHKKINHPLQKSKPRSNRELTKKNNQK